MYSPPHSWSFSASAPSRGSARGSTSRKPASGTFPSSTTAVSLKEIERFKPFTQYLFTDQPIYSFHSGIPVPPRLAILSLKRFWTGEMSNARLASELEALPPGLMLLSSDPGERCFQDLLNSHYQLVYEDAANRLYALKVHRAEGALLTPSL